MNDFSNIGKKIKTSNENILYSIPLPLSLNNLEK